MPDAISAPRPARAPCALLILSLAACGGGNTPPNAVVANPPAAPSLSLAVALKSLRFDWAATRGADFYRLLENPDGASGFTQSGGDLPAALSSTRRDIAVHRHDWQNARYVLEACNSAGCTLSNEVSSIGGLLSAIGYFKATNSDHQDFFGTAVALAADGNTLAIGAPQEDSLADTIDGDEGNDPDPLNTNYGAVYVFARDDLGEWFQQAYIKAPNASPGDRFGETVALSGDGTRLAVGATGEDADTAFILPTALHDESAPDSGAVYLYTRDAARQWSFEAYVKASNAEAGDLFGRRVALSHDGDVLAVGADFESSVAGRNPQENGAGLSGAVYIARRDGAGVWSYEGFIKAPELGSDPLDFFGYALALSGDGQRLAVGAWGEDGGVAGVTSNFSDDSVGMSGAVYVYTRAPTGWVFEAYTKAVNPGAGDQFGRAVALSFDGSTLAVGAEGEDSSATTVDGQAFDDSAGDSGAAYVFARDALGVWSQQAYIKSANASARSYLGRSLALSADGNTLAVGADGEPGGELGIDSPPTALPADNAGAVYLFARDVLGAWTQATLVKAPNTGADDQFGHAVALSGDARTLAVGADLEDSAARGIGGDQHDDALCALVPPQVCDPGAVYLY